MKKEIIENFQGKEKVIHIISDNGTESYLTQSRSFSDEANAIGASKLNTVENEKKHVLFLFDSDDVEVGRYYLGKALQGKTPSELIELKHRLAFFEAWNPESKSWVPCVGILNNNSIKDVASKAISFSNSQNNKKEIVDPTLSTEATKDDLANAWMDEYGVLYSADKKRLLKAPEDKLVNYNIKDGTIVICNKAFLFRRSLKSIIIPATVSKIGRHVFNDCSNLTSIQVDSKNRYYDSRNNCNAIIETRNNTLIRGCDSTIIPSSVSVIGEGAFYGCLNLKDILIPDSVSTIGNDAFLKCLSLTEIVIPNSVTQIGSRAFQACESLYSIYIPESVTQIGNSFLENCKSLISVHLLGSFTSISERAFSGCISLSDIAIPETVTQIGPYAFYGCESLTNISIPNSVTSINDYAFYECKSLDNIIIPDSVVYLGMCAFTSCSSLTHISIPNSIHSIEDSTFCDCSSLFEIIIPNTVDKIGEYAFYDCESLYHIIIPKGTKNKFESLLPDYKNILVEEGSNRDNNSINNTLEAILLASLWDDDDRSVKKTKHLLLLQHLLNNSMYMFKHPTDRSDRPSFMWNDEGLFMGTDSILPYTVPFLWIRTLAKRNVEKFNEVIDILKKEFGVEISEVIDVEDIVKGIRQFGFNDFNPNFDVHANKKLLSTFYGDCLSVNNFILYFGLNIDMNDLLPSRSNNVNIQSETIAMNNIINEMVDDFRNGKIEGN